MGILGILARLGKFDKPDRHYFKKKLNISVQCFVDFHQFMVCGISCNLTTVFVVVNFEGHVLVELKHAVVLKFWVFFSGKFLQIFVKGINCSPVGLCGKFIITILVSFMINFCN